MLKGLIQHLTQDEPSAKIEPIIIPRTEHTISRQAISPNALKVLYRLHHAGFKAYLVGGCVRDLLLGHQPKDFDIATNAKPEEIRKLFKNSRLIGKRFRLAHIIFGRDIIEVATFRTHHTNAEQQHAHSHQGMIIRDNVFGNIDDDAWRRDFTINALYYNIADFSVVDYINGMDDIKSRVLRIIGDPEKRFHEDPVRLLRAIRIIGKLKLTISPETEAPILQYSFLLKQVSPARLFQEVIKFFQSAALLETFHLLQKYKLFHQLFPQTASVLHLPQANQLIQQALTSSELRLKAGKTVSPAFLFAIFLWTPIKEQAKKIEENGLPPYVAFERAIHLTLKKEVTQLAIPRNMQVAIRDICFLQHRFTQRQGHRAHIILEHPRFRAAYDLLQLRAEVAEPVQELVNWWTQFLNGSAEERELLLKKTIRPQHRKRRKPRKAKSANL